MCVCVCVYVCVVYVYVSVACAYACVHVGKLMRMHVCMCINHRPPDFDGEISLSLSLSPSLSPSLPPFLPSSLPPYLSLSLSLSLSLFHTLAHTCNLQDQYIFLHDAILESVMCEDIQINAGNLRSVLKNLHKKDQSGSSKMDVL